MFVFLVHRAGEATVHLRLEDNGGDESWVHRDGDTLDDSGSGGRLHRKQTAGVPRLPRHVACTFKQLLESLPLLAVKQSLSPDLQGVDLHKGIINTLLLLIGKKNLKYKPFFLQILCRSEPLRSKKHHCCTSTGGLDICSIGGLDFSGEFLPL